MPSPTLVTPARPVLALRSSPWWSLISVALGVIMVGLDATVVAIANPKIAEDLGASLPDLQWITNSYLLALAVLLILGGKLGDRFGRRRVFLIGVVGFAVTSLLIGLVGSVAGIIVLRVFQGAFGALLMPNTLAILRAAFPAERLNMAIGIWGAASAASIAGGPIVGGLLVEHVNWESVFYINVPLGLVALLVGVLVLKESRDERDTGNDVPGVATLAAGLFGIVFGLIKAQDWGWGDERTLAFIVGGLLVLGLFVVIESRVAFPLLPMRLFANRSLSLSTIVLVINLFAMFGVLFFMTLYLQNVQGLSPVDAGLRTLPLTLAMVVSSPVGGAMTTRFGPRPPMFAGMVALSGSLFWLQALEADSAASFLIGPFVLVGIGLGLVMTSTSDAIVGNASVDDAGIAGGLQSAALQLGGVIGTAVLGSVLTSRIGSVLVDRLVAAGTPTPVANQLEAAKEYVGQGIAPPVPGAPAEIQAAVVRGSHEAFMSGLHTAMLVAAIVAVLGAVLTLFVQRGENSGTAVAVH